MDTRVVEYPEHLRRISVGYQNRALIGDRVFPIIPVGRRTGDYKRYGREAFQPVEDVREPGTRSRQVEELTVNRKPYRLIEHALNQPVTDEELEEGQYEFAELEAMRTQTLTARTFLGREKRIAAVARDPNNVQQNVTLSGTSQWSDPTGSDPYLNAFLARMTVRRGCGMRPETAIIPADVMEALKLNQSLAERLPNTTMQVLTEEQIRQLLGVERIWIPEVVEDVGADIGPDGTPEFVDVWGRDVLFAHIDDNPNGETLTFGGTLRLRSRRNQPDGPVRRWRQEPERATFVEVSYTETQEIICGEAAFLFRNVIPAGWMPEAA